MATGFSIYPFFYCHYLTCFLFALLLIHIYCFFYNCEWFKEYWKHTFGQLQLCKPCHLAASKFVSWIFRLALASLLWSPELIHMFMWFTWQILTKCQQFGSALNTPSYDQPKSSTQLPVSRLETKLKVKWAARQVNLLETGLREWFPLQAALLEFDWTWISQPVRRFSTLAMN